MTRFNQFLRLVNNIRNKGLNLSFQPVLKFFGGLYYNRSYDAKRKVTKIAKIAIYPKHFDRNKITNKNSGNFKGVKSDFWYFTFWLIVITSLVVETPKNF